MGDGTIYLIPIQILLTNVHRKGGASLEEIKSHRKAAKSVGESLLKLVSSRLPDFLEHVSSIFIAEGRIVVLMRERVRDRHLLEQCVRCVEELSMWSPTEKPV